ncbi:MAG: glycoside hydrolase family 99-like domain-containing protein [Verrucomicrobiae bacterium]|nr:glycoside hydrolase family 99-like domain-containing protein [Verrucomicrobiae bacterium]
MTRKTMNLPGILASLLTFIFLSEASAFGAPGFPPKSCEIAVYYFPQWHVDPWNKQAYKRDWTEWELVQRAQPRFEGHKQPKQPLWGFEMEDDPKVMAKKIEAAATHGVDVFVFDWYWLERGSFLSGALERGFLGAVNRQKLKFAVMWANDDIQYGRGAVSEDVFVKATDHMIRRYFPQPNYWRVGGALYLSIFRVEKLVEGLGGVKRTAEVLQRLRERVAGAGLGKLHLNGVQRWNQALDAKRAQYREDSATMRRLGFDSVTSYHWIQFQVIPDFPATSYARYRDLAVAAMRRLPKLYDLPYFPVVCMGWDSSPRTPQDKPFERKGYPWEPVLVNNTPAEFRKALEMGKTCLDNRPGLSRVLFIEAWNEWTEGSYLEPDTEHGFGYLEQIRSVFGHANR